MRDTGDQEAPSTIEDSGWDDTWFAGDSSQPGASWHDYPAGPEHTVVGTIKVSPTLYGPAEGVRRRLFVYLPPSYSTTEKRYPVLYMHDGQNLFDRATSYSGEWQVDETMEALSAEGIEAIVVGIANAGSGRAVDYSAHVHSHYGGGGADTYVDFLAQRVKTLVDSTFRTLTDREHTGLMGSSMGGSVSLYALLTRPDIFGFAGAISPAFWWSEGTIFPLVESLPFVGGRIYMDVGDSENPEIPGRAETYVNDARRMYALLRDKGYSPDDLYLLVEAGGAHHESAWARRLPGALRFLLRPGTGA